MKRLFAWLIMSLMGITAVMPSFIPLAKQDETPTVVQVENEEGVTPTIVPDKPTPEPEVKTDLIIPDSEAISWADVLNDYIAQKTEELNADIYETLKVPTTSEDYRGNELPSGYTQIEFLESTGTQYIDTGFTINSSKLNYEIDTGIKWTNTSGRNLMGYSAGLSGYFGRKGLYYEFGGTGTGILVSMNTFDRVQIIRDSVNYRMLVNDKSAASKSFDATSGVFQLFALSSSFICHCQINYCKIYEDEILVRDFIPCYDSNKVFGLYDAVGNQFYTNKGTGAFNNIITYTYPLQGSGTQADPYQISSAMDLAYVSSQTQTNTSFAKDNYFVLTNDIVLNDGYFEEDGTYHDGGDGKLYTWTPMNMNRAKFDGKRYTIYGLYKKSLFGAASEGTYKNFAIKKAFVNDSTAIVVGNVISRSTLQNITTDGCVVSTTDATAGIVGAISGGMTIANCKNYAKITNSAQRTAGIVAYHRENRGIIKNCENYGEIISSANCVGGIVADAGGYPTVENCINKGHIKGGSHLGGVVGRSYYSSGVKTIINCTNYGKVEGGASIGGVVGFLQAAGNTFVSYSKNKGKVISSGGFCGGVVGYVVSGSYAEVNNCENHGDVESTGYFSGGGIIGIVNSSSAVVTYCVNYGNITGKYGVCGIVGVYTISEKCYVSFCANYGTLKGNEVSGIMQPCAGKGPYRIVKNCANFGKMPSGGSPIERGTAEIINCIANCEIGNQTRKVYYGDNFDAFYVAWKDNHIGVKAIDGVGLYQWTVDESILSNLGFTKVA